MNSRRRDGRGVFVVGVTAVAAILVPRQSLAVNGQRLRVQPDFENVACLERVDRSAGDGVFHVEYSIAQEDTEVDPVDVPSGRKHQFLALGMQRIEALPFWISWADVGEAEAAGLINAAAVGDDDVFDTSTLWPAGTWSRITPDSPRVPITFDAAMMGVDWDTAAVPAGPHQILGYTWDPERNERRLRDGIVMVTDGDDPAAYPPGGHVRGSTTPVTEGDEVMLEACVDAQPGSVLSVWLGENIPDFEPEWREMDATFDGPEANGRGDVAVRFTLPFDLGGSPAKAYRVRFTVADPSGRTAHSYALARLEVLEDPHGPGGGETGDGAGVPGACACNAARRSAPDAGLLGFVTWGLARRRRPRWLREGL